MPSKTPGSSAKASKKSKAKAKIAIEEYKSSFIEDMSNAIEIKIIHIELQEGEVELGWTGNLKVSFGPHLVGVLDDLHLPYVGGRVPLDYRCVLQLPEVDRVVLDTLISTPLFFSLTAKLESKKVRIAAESGVLGQGNMDLLPLIMGKKGTAEGEVVMEEAGYSETIFFRRSSSENPRLLVRLTEIGDWTDSLPSDSDNLLWMTVESVFNPGQPYLQPDGQYTVVFPLPRKQVEILSDSEISEINETSPEKNPMDGGREMDDKRTKNIERTNTSDDSNCEESISESARLDGDAVSTDSDKGHSPALNIFRTTGRQVGSQVNQNRAHGGTEDRTGVTNSEVFSRSSCSTYFAKDDVTTETDDGETDNLAKDATKQKKKMVRGHSAGKKGPERGKRKEMLSERLMDFRLLEFPMGEWKEEPTFDLRKKWSSLANILGGPSKHTSRVKSDSSGIYSKFPVDLKKKMAAEQEPRITWNMVRPVWLDEDMQENMIRYIYKYGVWPVELVVVGGEKRDTPADGKKSKKKRSDAVNPSMRSFIAWVDLSMLLYPGNDSVRVCGQVQLFDREEGEDLWGLSSTLLGLPAETKMDVSLETTLSGSKKKGLVKRDLTKSDGYKQPTSSSGKTSKPLPSRLHMGQSSSVTNQTDLTSLIKSNVNSGETKYASLEKDYLELKKKYEKLKNVALHSTTPSSSVTISEDEDDSPVEIKDKEMHGLMQAKDALEEWMKLKHKKVLMKRYALASMRKKMLSEIMVHSPEKLSTAKGPTFVVVELKLSRPLVSKKPIETVENDVRSFLPDRSDEAAISKKRFGRGDFQNSILQLCSLITNEYREYREFDDDPGAPVDGAKFYDHLERSMIHLQISEILREVLSSYILDTVGSPLNELDVSRPRNKDYIDWLYCRLMEEITSTVNKYVMDRERSVPEGEEEAGPNISNEEYLLFATEAAEERDYERAKVFLSKMLEGGGARLAENWCSYAVIALRMQDYPKAIQCLREALTLDIRHKESLVMYAVLLTVAGMYDSAELFFNALLDFYPTFTEGWLIFHTFYLLVEKKIGADTTLIMASKCEETLSESETPYKSPQLAWDNSWTPKEHSAFLRSAVYLLSFNLYEMAEVCLAQDLELMGGKSQVFNYYLAVCHYIQGRYEDSAHHLLEAFENTQQVKVEPRLWTLLGHNKWEMGQKSAAVKLYQEAFMTGELQEEPHMAFLRCGFYFIDCEKPELAEQMFLKALQKVQTPMVWLGIGLSLYSLEKLEEAELALQEANVLDNQLAIAWAYLGLICLQKNKLVQAHQCFFEAKRCGLNDSVIEAKLRSLSSIVDQGNTTKKSSDNEEK